MSMSRSRFAIAAVSALTGLSAFAAAPALAGPGLGGTDTVQALYWNGARQTGSVPELQLSGGSGLPAVIGAGVDYTQGAASGSSIAVRSTSITITNLVSGAFCTTGSNPCPDSFDGFEFLITGASISGVTVDPVSAPDFLPTGSGLQNLSPVDPFIAAIQSSLSNNGTITTDILVDVEGDAPAIGDKLILDLAFGATNPPPVPEPLSLAVLGVGLTGLAAARARRRHTYSGAPAGRVAGCGKDDRMSDPYVGEIRPFAGTYAPVGWLLCDGSTLSIAQFEVLFNLIGTTYGGDGQTNFRLPDLRGRAVVHQGQGPGLSSYTIGQQVGQETVTLTVAQLPAHGHGFAGSTAAATTATPGTGVVPGAVATGTAIYDGTGAAAALAGSAVSSAGGSQPHGNRQPFVAVTYIIAFEGVYPSQN